MITALLIGLPLLAGLLALFVKGEGAKKVALGAALLELVLSFAVLYLFKKDPQNEQLFINTPWIQHFGIHFHLQLSGIGLCLVLLTTVLTPLIIISSYSREIKNPSLFYSLVLFMQMALVGVFLAHDGFLFYIFWELALIPIWFICLMWGESKNNSKITFKFFIYTLFGSLFMLAGLIYLYYHSPERNWSWENLQAGGMSLPEAKQGLVFWAMFLAFAVKMPVFPFHTWQPDTYTSSPTTGTMLLSGIMLKMGTFGLLFWLMPMVPLGIAKWGSTAIGLSVVGIVYASCMAIVQKDLKRLIAYSSIAHIGLIAAGILAFNAQGLQGAVMQMLAHGINVVGLFLIVDIISRQTGTREIAKLGGIRNVNPRFAMLYLIVLLGAVALPLTNGFVGEFLLISGVYKFNAWMSAFAGLTIILGAVYMLRSYQGVMLGETNNVTASFGALKTNETIVLFVVAALIIGLGVYPKPLMDLIGPDVQELLNSVKPAVTP
ncbi:MAG: NADH-quinone oxidoreductase subunit M [Bacteroidetes bacterium]|nr:MAG: NADH-quinone oxidoreductase subunit M [Bacteroidota bacterium]